MAGKAESPDSTTRQQAFTEMVSSLGGRGSAGRTGLGG